MEARTRHFVIYADEKPEELQAFAGRLERFDQAVRKVRGMTDPPLTKANLVTIYVTRNVDGIVGLAGGYGVLGFYISRASGSVAFVPRKAGVKNDPFDIDADTIFFHEYAHHLQLQYAELALPTWVSEGFAEFFARTRFAGDGTVTIGTPPGYRGFGLKWASDLTINELVGGDTELTDIEVEQLYGWGWLLTHYLTFTPERRGQLEQYIAKIQKGSTPLEAAGVFGDLKVLNRELNKYMRQSTLPALVLNGADLSPGEISLRALPEGQARMMRTRMRAKASPSERMARDIASDARGAAAPYPRDPVVQSVLAEAEFDAGNFEGASAAASRALEADPHSLAALVVKGRAETELARRNPASANWTAIGNWFVLANKEDAEAADPLLQFYRSYEAAGVPATPNAVRGLLYAVALAPQDNELRITAVRQLVADSRFKDATRLFAPFAFEPHSKESIKQSAKRVTGALAKNDGPGAAKELEKLQVEIEKARRS